MAARRRDLALRLAFAAALPLALATCIQDDGTRFNPLRKATEVSEEDEREVGYAFDQAARAQLDFIDDPVVVGFLNDLGQSMIRHLEPQPFIYRFRVVLDPSLNAFAVPGGYVYFHSGTLMRAGSLDEVAGIMGHEIAHVKGRHYKRMVEQNALPSLLTQLAGIAAAVAAGSPAPMVAAQGANIAVQLRFSRTFEREADRYGAVFVSRSGYEVRGMRRFFDRILAEQARLPRGEIPAYLYTHPDLEERIHAVDALDEELDPLREAPPELEEAYRRARLRLGRLIHARRSVWREPRLPADAAEGAAALARAEALLEAGDPDAALRAVRAAEDRSPTDSRLPLRRGEILQAQRRFDEAIAAYRRAVDLSPTTSLILYRTGHLYGELGDRHRGVFYLEQAMAHSTPTSQLHQRAEAQVARLTFPPFAQAGLCDRFEDGTPGRERLSFAAGAPVVWWAEVARRYAGERDALRVRWRDPEGAIVREATPTRERRRHVSDRLVLASDAALGEGWSVEVLLQGDVVARRAFEVRASDLELRSEVLEAPPAHLRPGPVGLELEVAPPVIAGVGPQRELLAQQRQVHVGVGVARVELQHGAVVA